MKHHLFIILAVLSLLVTSCQSDTYKIEGHGDSLVDGDTILLTPIPADGNTIATAVVSKGKFHMEDIATQVRLCQLSSKSNPAIGATLFLEAGTIKVELASLSAATSRVSGTPCNRKWQQLCDSLMDIGAELGRTVEFVQKNARNISREEQEEAVRQIDRLQQRSIAIITNAAEENIDNEFGYALLLYFDGVIPAAKRLELISQLPHEMRQRPEIDKVAQQLEQEMLTSEGAKLPDFTMNTIKGKPLRLYDEIARHKLTLIDFWASWCGPCRREMPNVVALYKECSADGLGIIGVSLDKNEKAWKDATKELGIQWQQVSDLKGWNNEIARGLNVNSIPHTIVVDSTGTIIATGLRGNRLAQLIKSRLQ